MTDEQISIITRIIDKTVADEISWKRESQYLIGKDNDGYTYCLQPHMDMSRKDSSTEVIEKLKPMVHIPPYPQITVFWDKGERIIKAAMIQCEDEGTDTLDLKKEIIDPSDKKLFERLLSEALRSLVRTELK